MTGGTGDEPTTTRLPGPWWAVSIAKVRRPEFREEAKAQITGDARPLLGFVVAFTTVLIIGPVTLTILWNDPQMSGAIAVMLGAALASNIIAAAYCLGRLLRQLGLR